MVASPIALATKLAEDTSDGDSGGPADFLSSIEIAVVDRADVLLMQNWAHVTTGISQSYLIYPCHKQNKRFWYLRSLMLGLNPS